jgi:hypothetical protein
VNIWGHKEWAPKRKTDPLYDMDQMRQRIDTHANEEDAPMSAAEADRVIAEVNKARDLLYEIRRGKIPDGHGGFVADPGHAEMADTTANARLSALGAAVAKIGTQIGALSDDEAKILAATGAAETKILAAVQAVIINPSVNNADPEAFVVALRDALVRGEPPA